MAVSRCEQGGISRENKAVSAARGGTSRLLAAQQGGLPRGGLGEERLFLVGVDRHDNAEGHRQDNHRGTTVTNHRQRYADHR